MDNKKIYKCPSCGSEKLLAESSYRQAVRLKRICKSCAMKKWQLEKYGLKKDRVFFTKCPKCNKNKEHIWKNQSETQLKRLEKDLSKKLCKNCSNSIYYILPKIKSNTKPEIKFKDILRELGIEYIQSFKLKNKFYDFYLQKENILIEIDGVYWHAKNLDNKQLNSTQKHNKENDKLKNLIAEENNILLLRFWEDEIDTKNVIKRLYESKTHNME